MPATPSSFPPENPGPSKILTLCTLCVGIMAISTGAIFARIAGEAHPLVIAAWRVGFAAVLLTPFVLIRSIPEIKCLSISDLRQALLAGIFLSLHFAAWITSLSHTSVVNSVVFVNTIPIWVGIFSPIVAREHIRKETKVSIGICIVGGLVIGAGGLAVGEKTLFGDFLALLGGLFASFYLLLGRNLRRRVSLLTYIFLCYGSAAVILWLLVWILGLPVSGFETKTWGALFAVAVVPQLIGHTVYNWGLKWFSAGMVSVGLFGEPIGSTILAFFLFGEGLTLPKLTGCILILFAIYHAARGN